MDAFTIFPAIDLQHGIVVRLRQGDPHQATNYNNDPVDAARHWLEIGAKYLHVVNLDGAFGAKESPNEHALKKIIEVARVYNAGIQFGGGLRSIQSIRQAFKIGVKRVILGTMAVENPESIHQVLIEFGSERVGASLDVRDGYVHIHGWKTASKNKGWDAANQLTSRGVRWLVFTDISRDGLGNGINIDDTQQITQIPNLNVIASGGVSSLDDVRQARDNGCGGIIIGRALYENIKNPLTGVNLKAALEFEH